MSKRHSETRRRAAAVGLAGMLALALSSQVTTPAIAQQAGDANGPYFGYAHGTVAHVDIVQSGTTRLVDVEEAASSAVVDSRGLTGTISNEMQRIIQPPQPGKNTYARGAGLEVGVNQPPNSELAQVQQGGRAEAAAAPSTDLIQKQLQEPSVSPVVYASLLKGQAQARWLSNNCITGQDLARGLGYAADAQLVDTAANTATPTLDAPVLATDHPSPERRVAQSVSRNKLTVQSTKPEVGKPLNIVGPNFGLMSEVRENIAPVTLLKGTPNQTTIEFLGEWVLQAVAGGLPNTAFMHYGPAAASPDTPVLRILNATGAETRVLTLQQVTGANGLSLPANPVIELKIGEPPRQIGDPTKPAVAAANGTTAAGAVDVVRVKILEQRDAAGNVTQRAADLRIGHMEATATVPVGGITCPGVRVTKEANPREVLAGQEFVYTIGVTNLTTCPLTSVVVTDTITVTPGVVYEILSVQPAEKTPRPPTGPVVELGDLPAGQTKTVTVRVKVLDTSAPGKFTNTAVATGNCGPGSAQGGANVTVPLRGEVRIELPNVRREDARELPATGGIESITVLGLASLAGALGLRRTRRRVSNDS